MKRQDLHEYQNYCVDYLKTHSEAILILSMGLGKSVISLTAIADLMFDSFEVGKTLVIAPLRVCTNVWPEELENWEHVSSLQMSVITGTEKQRKEALNTPADVYVINRENVKWLTDWLEKNKIPWPFDMVVIDELSSFKNHESKRWKALRKVRPYINRIVGLTGTPTGNSLMDLWAETYLIDKGERLGKFISHYREAYFKEGDINPYTGVVYNYILRPGADEAIYSRISDITVSMKSLDYLQMPEQVTVNHYVEMDPREQGGYDRMKNEMLVQMNGDLIDAKNAAVLSGKLLQMANGAVYNDQKEMRVLHNRKLEMLGDLIEQANGQSVLVAYWFQHDQRRIMDYLTELGYTPRDLKSKKDISDWNDGNIQVALISPASAGHGLNIQKGGHILIWFSLVWSLELYQQTNARLWRQGQSETVVIHHIITDGTVDNHVLKALQSKEKTQNSLIAAVKAELYK